MRMSILFIGFFLFAGQGNADHPEAELPRRFSELLKYVPALSQRRFCLSE
jgi:hypothetical protein